MVWRRDGENGGVFIGAVAPVSLYDIDFPYLMAAPSPVVSPSPRLPVQKSPRLTSCP
ncbi:hypothetical protein [[Phormidium] sp. ETS-05]|uniref:hypothetical protein n=1 Tax=[Phormidium] sp. ETS-05 TaxID=222819 RepID=UPI0018EEDB24|nr:hypothetical protein [[Phormidium] sp. ETS-05]